MGSQPLALQDQGSTAPPSPSCSLLLAEPGVLFPASWRSSLQTDSEFRGQREGRQVSAEPSPHSELGEQLLGSSPLPPPGSSPELCVHRSSCLSVSVSVHAQILGSQGLSMGIVRSATAGSHGLPLSLIQGLPALSHLEPGALWGRRWKPYGHRLVRLHPGGPHPSVPQDSVLVTAFCPCCCPPNFPCTIVPAPLPRSFYPSFISLGGPRCPGFW